MITKCKAHLIIPFVIIIVSAVSAFPRPQQTEAKPYVLKPIKTVYPIYPEHLKKEGIAGEVIILVWIDEKGDINLGSGSTFFYIRRSLHPELDKLAVEAVKQWKYEPVVYEGKTIGAFTFISLIFDPGELPEVEDSVPREPLSEELIAIIDRGWEYCRKVDDIAH